MGRYLVLMCVALALVCMASEAMGIDSLVFSLDIRYDDNVFQFSDNDRNRIDPKSPKYRDIVQSSDIITTPALRMDLSLPYRIGLRFSYRHNLYLRNTVKDYGVASIRAGRVFSGVNTVILRYSYVPEFYLRNLYVDGGYSPARFSLQKLSFRYTYRFSRTFRAGFGYRWEVRDYSAPFDDRDSVTDVVMAGLKYSKRVRELGRIRLMVSPFYASRDSKSPIEATSYRSFGVGLKGRLRFKSSPYSLRAGYSYYKKNFITSITGDIHFSREDVRQEIGLGLLRRFGKNIMVGVGYRYIRNDSNRGYARFTNNIASLRVRYRL